MKNFKWPLAVVVIVALFFLLLFVRMGNILSQKDNEIRSLHSQVNDLENGATQKKQRQEEQIKKVDTALSAVSSLDEKNLWEVFGENPHETAVAVTNTMGSCQGMYGCVNRLMGNLKDRLVKDAKRERPKFLVEGEDDVVLSKYDILSDELESLSMRIRHEFEGILKNPANLLAWIEKYGDGIASILPRFTKVETMTFFKEVKCLYVLAQNEAFKNDMKAFLVLESSGDFNDSDSLRKHYKAIGNERKFLQEKWKISFRDQQAIFRHFSAKPEEWGKVFILSEKMLAKQ